MCLTSDIPSWWVKHERRARGAGVLVGVPVDNVRPPKYVVMHTRGRYTWCCLSAQFLVPGGEEEEGLFKARGATAATDGGKQMVPANVCTDPERGGRGGTCILKERGEGGGSSFRTKSTMPLWNIVLNTVLSRTTHATLHGTGTGVQRRYPMHTGILHQTRQIVTKAELVSALCLS